LDKDLELLIRLQVIDDEISRRDKLLEKLPAEIDLLSSKLDSARAELERFHHALEENNKQRLAKEREVEEHNSAIAKAKGKLNDVKTNEEYKAVLREIDNMTGAISRLEDEQLELMEKVDASRNEEKRLKEKLEEEEREFQRLKAEKEAEIKQKKIERDDAIKKRDELAAQIDGKKLAHYQKVFGQRDGKAVVELNDGFCSACHQAVLPQVALEIRTGTALHTCQHCSRFLYVVKENKPRDNKVSTEGGQTAAG